MASNGFYILANDPGESYTDESFTYTIYTSGTMTGVTYSFGWEFTCDGVTTKETVASELTSSTYTWAPTSAKFGPLMKKSASGTLKIIVKTINGRGDTYSREFTLKLNESVKPAISSISIARTNGFNNQSVSNITDHTLSFKVAGVYGANQRISICTTDATTQSTDIAPAGTGTTNMSFAIGSFDSRNSATKTINVTTTVTDDRGRSATAQTSITIYKYSPPDVVATVARNDNEQPVLTFTPSYQATVAGASNTLKTFWVRGNVDGTVYETDLKGKTSPQVLTGTYDLSKSYQFTILIQDSVRPSGIIKRVVLPSARPVMDIGADGNTVTFFGTSPSSATKETLRIGEVASFGEEVVLGNVSDKHTKIGSGGLSIYGGVDYLIGEIGYGNTKNENGDIVEDCFYTLGNRNNGTTIGSFSVAAGFAVETSGYASFAEGANTTASGVVSHAEGDSTTASGDISHAEGDSTTASGVVSHAEGGSTTASGDISHAEGYHTIASGAYSHAEGASTTAAGFDSHAEGYHTIASGAYSHAGGYYTKASGDYQTVVGEYNIEDSASKYLFIVGNGTSDTARSNALGVTNTGHIDVQKKIYLNTNGEGIFQQDSGGTNRELLTLNTANNLSIGYGQYSNGSNGVILYSGNSINFQLKSPSASWKPYFAKGDTITATFGTAGYITNSGKDVTFIIPLSRPIIGNPTITVASVTGLTVRENNLYLYGSTSSTCAKPSKYTVYSTLSGSAIRVVATMANTTNVTNNSPCGVWADIKITFS